MNNIHFISLINSINSIQWNAYIFQMKPSLSNLSSYLWKCYYNNIADWFQQLTSCYYIGTGNPCSEIIFIGKELAFDKTNLDLFFHEMFTNYLKWREIVNDYLINPSNFSIPNINSYISSFEKNYIYCPLNPLTSRLINNKKKNENHYWFKCKYIIEKYYGIIKSKKIEITDINSFPQFTDSLFRYCFTTELNTIPAKRTGGDFDPNSLICNKYFIDFLRSFRLIWFNCWTYLKNKSRFKKICSKYPDYVTMIQKEFGVNRIISKAKYEIFKDPQWQRAVVVSYNLANRYKRILDDSDINEILSYV